MGRLRLLLGMSVFWLGLSMLADGLTTLVLPAHLLGLTDEASKARTLGPLSVPSTTRASAMSPNAGTRSTPGRAS